MFYFLSTRASEKEGFAYQLSALFLLEIKVTVESIYIDIN